MCKCVKDRIFTKDLSYISEPLINSLDFDSHGRKCKNFLQFPSSKSQSQEDNDICMPVGKQAWVNNCLSYIPSLYFIGSDPCLL